MNKALLISAAGLACLTVLSCKTQPNEPETSPLKTLAPTEIAMSSAVLCGHVDPSFDARGAKLGFILSPTYDPMDVDAIFLPAGEPDADGNFYAKASGLTPRKTFYYWARIQADGTEWIGDMAYFLTWEILAVDIGLSVKWADYNVGATFREPLGLYFTWGGLEGARKVDDPLPERWEDGSKYSGKDRKLLLDPEDDVAHVTMGEPWRMPTFEETQELVNSRDDSDYKWTHTTLEGVPGWEVEYLPNGNRIFFPALKHESTGSYTGYWSSELDSPDNGYLYAWGWTFRDDGPESLGCTRNATCLVRAVRDER